MRYTTAAMALALLALGAGGAAAQASCNQHGNSLPVSCSLATAAFTAKVPAIVSLATNGTEYTFADATLNDLDVLHYLADATHPTLTAKSNIEYDINASLAAFTFASPVHVGQPDPGKPVADFTISGGAGYTALSTTGASIYDGARGTATVAAPARINLAFATDPAGTYGGTITFTIVAK